ncbi:unnamed protein product [Strongylus vulgaris]|uniref:Uncharacterized protein n=1 Tax=Strongylus vulgaris TaxID=40348 RepID=A0A3P7K2Q7_STRVU|nr:unnamed protein product [Strongylus vulgaris]
MQTGKMLVLSATSANTAKSNVKTAAETAKKSAKAIKTPTKQFSCSGDASAKKSAQPKETAKLGEPVEIEKVKDPKLASQKKNPKQITKEDSKKSIMSNAAEESKFETPTAAEGKAKADAVEAPKPKIHSRQSSSAKLLPKSVNAKAEEKQQPASKAVKHEEAVTENPTQAEKANPTKLGLKPSSQKPALKATSKTAKPISEDHKQMKMY